MSGYRPPYTIAEEKTILRYIIDNKGFYSLRGRAFWIELENAKLLERTWQSCKEHFIKQIYPKLNISVFGLTVEEAAQIRDGFESTANNGYPVTGQRNVQSRKADFDIADIIDTSDED